jgi:predicted dehydrogenase
VTIGLGVVGCGWAASEVARVVTELPEAVIRCCYDSDPARAAAFAERTAARVAPDASAAVGAPDVDLVYIGLPHALLAGAVDAALNQGKHVLAEKPLSLDPAEARRLGALARRRGLVLAVFFELRRAGTVEQGRRLVMEGAIGEPKLVRVRTLIDKRDDYWGSAGAPNWRGQRALAGGGVLLMNTIHQLDTLRYVTGANFVSAMGDVAAVRAPVEVEDAGSATLRMSNGALVNLVASAHSPGATREETIELEGPEGRLDLPDPFGTAPIRLYRREEGAWRDIAVTRPDSHRAMLLDVLTAVSSGGVVPAGAEDAVAAVEAVQAIYRSAIERRVVDIAPSTTGQ